MKTTLFILQNPLRLFLALTVPPLALSACTVTRTSDPYIPGEEPTMTKVEASKKKRFSNLFSKSLGDAEADFRRDNRGGRLKLKQYGAPGPLTPYFNKLLIEDLGIEIEVIADGLIPQDELRYAKQYNALMTAEIQKKYGPEILQEARRRALIMKAQVEKSTEM